MQYLYHYSILLRVSLSFPNKNYNINYLLVISKTRNTAVAFLEYKLIKLLNFSYPALEQKLIKLMLIITSISKLNSYNFIINLKFF